MFSAIKKSNFNKQIELLRKFVINEKLKWYKERDIDEEITFPVSAFVYLNNGDCVETNIYEDGDISIIFEKKEGDKEIWTNVSFEISSNWTMVSQSTYSKEPFELIGDIELIDLDIGNEKQIFIDYANKFLTLYKKYNK